MIAERIDHDNFPRTQQEVADLYGISKCRVQQIEQRALRKLREGLGEDAGELVRMLEARRK